MQLNFFSAPIICSEGKDFQGRLEIFQWLSGHVNLKQNNKIIRHS